MLREGLTVERREKAALIVPDFSVRPGIETMKIDAAFPL